MNQFILDNFDNGLSGGETGRDLPAQRLAFDPLDKRLDNR